MLPFTFVCSHETSVQVPTSCSFGDGCWPAALTARKDSASAELVHAPRTLRGFIGVSPGAKTGTGWLAVASPSASLCTRTLPIPSDSRKARGQSHGDVSSGSKGGVALECADVRFGSKADMPGSSPD